MSGTFQQLANGEILYSKVVTGPDAESGVKARDPKGFLFEDISAQPEYAASSPSRFVKAYCWTTICGISIMFLYLLAMTRYNYFGMIDLAQTSESNLLLGCVIFAVIWFYAVIMMPGVMGIFMAHGIRMWCIPPCRLAEDVGSVIVMTWIMICVGGYMVLLSI